MENLTPQKIAEITGGSYIGSDADRNVTVKGAVRDNRDVKPGNLFVCIQGKNVDGHSFANKAFNAGAACCLAEKKIPDATGPYVLVESTLKSIIVIGKYYRSLFNIPIIGITGSVGKTTAKEIIATVLEAKFCVLKTKMNFNNELGVPLTLLSLDEKHEAAVIEMGVRDFGDMTILTQMVRPDIFVMTRIGYSHILELGDLQGVLRAKTEAFALMKPTGIAVLNGDDELLMGYDPKMRKITFGLEKHNDVCAVNIKTDGFNAISFDIVSEEGNFRTYIPAYGNHIAALAPAAVIVARLLGLTDEEINKGFMAYTSVEGRSRVVNTGYVTLIDDCYNANPNSVKAALTSIPALPGRRVAILGDMLNLGTHSDQMHIDIGVFAAQSGIDALLCHGTNARLIYDGYISANGSKAKYYKLMNELIDDIPNQIKKGDAVLVKASRGMHFEQLLPVISDLKSE